MASPKVKRATGMGVLTFFVANTILLSFDEEYRLPSGKLTVPWMNTVRGQGRSLVEDRNATSSALPLDSNEIKDAWPEYKTRFQMWYFPFRPFKDADGESDVPVFWSIPGSQNSEMEHALTFCYGLTLASAAGATFEDKELREIVDPATRAKYVNVDVNNPEGIKRATKKGLAASGKADIISTPYIYEATALFQWTPQTGKCFVMMKHPVARAVSLYHRHQKIHVHSNETARYKGISFQEYAKTSTENNWMVRFLTGKRSGNLSTFDLQMAKRVLGAKCLVGLDEKAEESVKRFEYFFKWNIDHSKSPKDTHERESLNGSLMKSDSCVAKTFERKKDQLLLPTYVGTEAWEILRRKNFYDILLYEYAKVLYSHQDAVYKRY